MTIDIAAIRAWLADINDNADEIGMVAEALPDLLAVYEAALAWRDASALLDAGGHGNWALHNAADEAEAVLAAAVDRARGVKQ